MELEKEWEEEGEEVETRELMEEKEFLDRSTIEKRVKASQRMSVGTRSQEDFGGDASESRSFQTWTRPSGFKTVNPIIKDFKGCEGEVTLASTDGNGMDTKHLKQVSRRFLQLKIIKRRIQ